MLTSRAVRARRRAAAPPTPPARDHETVTAWAVGGPSDPARELAARLSVRKTVLLEGPSDAAAVSARAASRGRNLAAEGVCVLPMGGAMSVGHFARLLGPPGLGLRLTGLCDANSTWDSDFQGRRGLINSVLNKPIVDSIRALSYASTTEQGRFTPVMNMPTCMRNWRQVSQITKRSPG